MGERNEDAGDREQRRFVTTAVTKLHAKPRGRVLRELAAGTRVRVTGDKDNKYVPVAVPEQHVRGWVRETAIAPVSRPDDPTTPVEPLVEPPVEPVQPSPVQPGPGQPAGNVGERLAAEAQKYIGFQYVHGKRGPTQFDCSGLVHWVVKQVTGQEISGDSHDQFNLGRPVGAGQLAPGDLLFYDTMNGQEVRAGNAASHVGIFVAPGRMVNALNPELDVQESDPFSPYFEPRFIAAKRLHLSG